MTRILCLDLLNNLFTLRHSKEKDPLWRFITDIRNIAASIKADKIMVCTDTGQSKYRLDLYPQYKEQRRAKRANATEEEKAELQGFFDVVDLFKQTAPTYGLEVISIPRVEADDLLAFFALKAEANEYEAFLLSSDTDALQLLRPGVFQRSYADKMKLLDVDIPPQVWINESRFKEIFQMTPAQYLEAKSISGDTGDSIYSPDGVGKETGFKLIRKYGSIENVEKNLDDLDIPRFSAKGRENLKNEFHLVHRNLELISLLHTEDKFEKIFGKEGLKMLEDILAKITEPPVVDQEKIKEYLFETGRVGIYYDFENWIAPFMGRR